MLQWCPGLAVNPKRGGDCTPSSAVDLILAVAMEMGGEEAVDNRTDVRSQIEEDH